MASREVRFPGVVGSDGPRVELSMPSSPLVTGAVRRPHTPETPAPYISTGSPAPVCVGVSVNGPLAAGDAECVSVDDTLTDAARKLRDLQVGAMPICGDDNWLALITVCWLETRLRDTEATERVRCLCRRLSRIKRCRR